MIDVKKATWSIRMVCRVHKVFASGCYTWRNHPESERSQEDRCLKAFIEAARTRRLWQPARPRRAEGQRRQDQPQAARAADEG